MPSIFVDSGETTENSSVVDYDLKMADAETISMIVRNVEAFEKIETRTDSDEDEFNLEEIELTKIEEPSPSAEMKAGSPKKHDFIHGLKDSIQERFHHLSDNMKKHDMKVESPPREHGKMFHGLKENVSGKFHQIAEKMHNFHLPHLPHHQHDTPHDSLVSQAMQTILMEKFNIVEASTAINSSTETMQKRKSSSSSLQSIKQKFNLFQRPRRPGDMQSDTSSLKSISEVNAQDQSERESSKVVFEIENEKYFDDEAENSSVLELKIHNEPDSEASNESLITVLSNDKYFSKDNLKASVENFDSFLSNHPPFSNATTFADTNKSPLHESLLSLSRNELISTSPGVKMHERTESIGCKFTVSPSKNTYGSLGKDQMLTSIHRRSSDSDLSITPKLTQGELSSNAQCFSFAIRHSFKFFYSNFF